MKADVIDISEENYGTFYLDALDHPNRYDDKVVRFKGQVFAEPGRAEGVLPLRPSGHDLLRQRYHLPGLPVPG